MTVGGPRQFLASLLVPSPCPFHLPHQNCPQGQGCWVLVENEVPTWWGLLVAPSWLLVSFSQAVLLMMVCWYWMDSREIYMNGAKLKLFCKLFFFFFLKKLNTTEIEQNEKWICMGFFFFTEWVTKHLKSNSFTMFIKYAVQFNQTNSKEIQHQTFKTDFVALNPFFFSLMGNGFIMPSAGPWWSSSIRSPRKSSLANETSFWKFRLSMQIRNYK